MARKPNLPGGQGGRPPLPDMRRGLKPFIEDVVKEMRRVVWPTGQETLRLTIAVLFVCLLFILYLWASGTVIDIIIRAMEGQPLR